jgi:hypothetical protein
VRERPRVSQIVHGDKVNLFITQSSAQNVPTNATKTVNANLNCHLESPCNSELIATAVLHQSQFRIRKRLVFGILIDARYDLLLDDETEYSALAVSVKRGLLTTNSQETNGAVRWSQPFADLY